MAGVGEAECLQAFFRHRAGDDGIGAAVFELAHGFIQGGERGGSGAGVGLAESAGAAVA